MTTKNLNSSKGKPGERFYLNPIILVIGLVLLLIAAIILFKMRASGRSLIPMSAIALIAGLFYESKRLTEKWKTVFYMALGSFIFSVFSLLPGRHLSIFNLESFVKIWPYYFILIFVIISITFNKEKIIPKLTEGITLIQSLAIIYWVIDFGFFESGNLLIKILLFTGIGLSLYSAINAFSGIALTRLNRLILSLWSSIIMLLFAIDNIYEVYQNGQIEITQNPAYGLYVGLQYFLLGICSIYIIQNFLMLTGFLPGKGRFFNAAYFRNVKKLKEEHISRYSVIQVNKLYSLYCLVLVGTFFSLNYFIKFLPRNIAIWIVFVVFPYVILIYDHIRNFKNDGSDEKQSII